jgi:hypothetical protein
MSGLSGMKLERSVGNVRSFKSFRQRIARLGSFRLLLWAQKALTVISVPPENGAASKSQAHLGFYEMHVGWLESVGIRSSDEAE